MSEIVRGGLKPKQVKKASIKKQMKNLCKLIESKSRYIRKLERTIAGKTSKQSWYDSIPKCVLPSRLDVYESHIEFDRKVLARSLVLGKPNGDMSNYPATLTANTFTKIKALGGRKGANS